MKSKHYWLNRIHEPRNGNYWLNREPLPKHFFISVCKLGEDQWKEVCKKPHNGNGYNKSYSFVKTRNFKE